MELSTWSAEVEIDDRRRELRPIVAAALAIFAVSISTRTVAVPTYTATPIGTDNFGTSINAAGQILAEAQDGTFSFAFIYDGNVGTNLGALGGQESFAGAINKYGHATGSASVGEGFDDRAFVYANGKMTNLGALTSDGVSYGYGINDSDQVTGESLYAGTRINKHAFIFSNGSMTDLGTFSGVHSAGYAINNGGQVTGTADVNGGQGSHAFLYSDGHMFDLGTLGGSSSEGHAINDQGQIAGFAYLAGNNDRHAFIYSDGVMRDLGTLGGTSSEAYAINSIGQVTGTSYVGGNVTWPHAFLYSGGTMHDLNSLVVSGLNGAVLSTARGINDSGQIVATSCVYQACRIYRLDPAGEVDPPTIITVAVIEYHHSRFDHYFITPVAAEIALLDAKVPPFEDWSRTGFSFNAYTSTNAPISSTANCRFFNDHFAPKSSHFYAPHGLGCEETIAKFPDWTLESDNLFRSMLPNAIGACPAGTIEVYRLYNNGMGGAPNHRFTTSRTERQAMLDKGYISEGASVAGVGMCVPP